ncbi:MAG: hypothetical protein OEY86_20145 [Nitrospira sp.]|nr:hypothetical protein [Nitrospira sp.]
MEKFWTMMQPVAVILLVLAMVGGCQHGRWSESGLMIEGDAKAKKPAHWLVARVQDNYRVWIQQPQVVSYSHCSQKRTSVQMAQLRFPDTYRASGYTGPIEFEGTDANGFISEYRQCKDVITAQVTSGQSIFSQVAGPGSIVVGAWLIRDGLKGSRDNVTNNNNTSAQGGAGGAGGSASNMTNSGNTNIKGPSTTNINSGNTNIMK